MFSHLIPNGNRPRARASYAIPTSSEYGPQHISVFAVGWYAVFWSLSKTTLGYHIHDAEIIQPAVGYGSSNDLLCMLQC